jgi:hypothetical protein
MELDALRLLILSKLADGRLPLHSLPRVWGGPGNGETCDACGAIVTKREFVMEATSLAGGRKPLHLHAECFWVWEAERRPQLASGESASAPVTTAAPAHGTSTPVPPPVRARRWTPPALTLLRSQPRL